MRLGAIFLASFLGACSTALEEPPSSTFEGCLEDAEEIHLLCQTPCVGADPCDACLESCSVELFERFEACDEVFDPEVPKMTPYLACRRDAWASAAWCLEYSCSDQGDAADCSAQWTSDALACEELS